MYLIFSPSSEKKIKEQSGLNDAVPQAADIGMQSDKQKAYEQAQMEQKEQAKKSALMKLSDYWNADSAEQQTEYMPEEEDNRVIGGRTTIRQSSPALSSYQNAQSSLNSFYREDNRETIELQRQVEELKERLAEKDIPPTVTVNDQLALMEKSYQMAAKYLPTGLGKQESESTEAKPIVSKPPAVKEQFVALTPSRKSIISALYREPTDSAFIAEWNNIKARTFFSANTRLETVQLKNSIKACVHETQTVAGESGVRLRLLEPVKIPGNTIAQGTILTANAIFQGGRLQLKISSVEYDGSIFPVEITIYDLDGQQGLFVPISPERNALAEMAGNMSQTSGTSIMMSRSAGQQLAGDLSRSVVQGVSGYFSKRVRTPKVTLKAGHQVLLVSKK